MALFQNKIECNTDMRGCVSAGMVIALDHLNREKIFVVRRGLARAYDVLVEDPSLHITRVHHDDTNNNKYMMLVI